MHYFLFEVYQKMTGKSKVFEQTNERTVVEETANKDLIYCQKVLTLLEHLEDNKQKSEIFYGQFEKRIIRKRRLKIFVLGILLLAVIVVGGEFVHLSLGFLLFLIIALMSLYIILMGVSLRRFTNKSIIEQVDKKQRKILEIGTKKLEVERKGFKRELASFDRIPTKYQSVAALRHLIRYFERGEAQSLEEALYFLGMDEKNRTFINSFDVF